MKQFVSSLLIPFIATLFVITTAKAQTVDAAYSILRTNVNQVSLFLDGKPLPGGWLVMYGDQVDSLYTKAREIVFASDMDTLAITLERWQSKDFTIVSGNGEKAPISVTRISENIYEYPNPELLQRSPNGLLSRNQAAFDLNALIYGLSEIHPDPFSVCRQTDFFRAVNHAIETLPDSISTTDLYRTAAPIVAMIGDGHTNLVFPFNDLFTAGLKRMPLRVNVVSDKSIICRTSPDSIIPSGARIISINGVSAEAMVNAMLPYVAGEKEAFKIARADKVFPALYQLFYPADTFEVVYLPVGGKKPMSVTYPAMTSREAQMRSPALPKANTQAPYSFTTDKKRNVAVMDFREFKDKASMEAFADSMFRELRNQQIGNLIIDLRQNGGGNSAVGDVLLRYISHVPFTQMDKALVRISPLTKKLIEKEGEDNLQPGFLFYETDEGMYTQPLTPEEGLYQGHVYLLTSNITFSSASSFAWVFKECGMGTVIGEETGGMNVCYGDILDYRLPVSGLHCSISFKRFWQFHADEDSIHGTIPDVSVPAMDAFDTALKIIKAKKRM